MDWLSFFQQALPLLAAVLLAGTIAQGIRRVCRPQGTADTMAEAWDQQATRTAGLQMFAVCAAGVAFFALCALEANPGKSLEAALPTVFPTSMDADHYLKLAQYGYGTGGEFEGQQLMIVFFPLFPWLVRLVCRISGLGVYTVGVCVQPVLFGIGGAALHRLVQPRFGQQTANQALAFLLLLPGSFFFAAPMTESLYFALSMLAFLCLEEEKPAGFALFGFLTALTRSTGGLLAGVAGVVWLSRLLQKERAAPWLAAALGPAAGTGVYLLLNYSVYGDFFAYAAIQKSHWNNELGWVGNTVRYHLGYAADWWESNRSFAVYVSLLAVVMLLAECTALFASRKKLPVPWLAYGVAYLLVTGGTSWLLSAPRYALSLPFFPLGMALVCRTTRQKTAVCCIMAVVWLLYLREYLNYGPIY